LEEKILFERWKQHAKRMKSEIIALYYASQDPRAGWYAKFIILLVVGYALSPIDLIPDFIPVLGYLDDLILIPLGVALAIRIIPREVLDEARGKAESTNGRPQIRIGAVMVVLIWLLFFGWLLSLVL
jgi:uncharacterized membrane protein YkvA (DUF1232 family)